MSVLLVGDTIDKLVVVVVVVVGETHLLLVLECVLCVSIYIYYI